MEGLIIIEIKLELEGVNFVQFCFVSSSWFLYFGLFESIVIVCFVEWSLWLPQKRKVLKKSGENSVQYFDLFFFLPLYVSLLQNDYELIKSLIYSKKFYVCYIDRWAGDEHGSGCHRWCEEHAWN